MKKQPELTAQTKRKLIDTYFALVADGEKATVGAVTEAAGYNRCTFYRYFTDTEQLLDQVETEICGAFQKALEENYPAAASPAIVESFVAVYQEYGQYLSVLLGKQGSIRFTGRMKSIMQPIASQFFSETSNSDAVADLKAEFALSAVLATITKWYDMNRPIPTEELGGLLKGILQQGVFDNM